MFCASNALWYGNERSVHVAAVIHAVVDPSVIFVAKSTQAFGVFFCYDYVVSLILDIVATVQLRTASDVQGRGMSCSQCPDGTHYVIVVMMPLPLNRLWFPILAKHAII